MSAARCDLLIGVDGGGSHTTALVADGHGNVLGRGSAGASNYQALGSEPACQAIRAAIDAALAAANCSCLPRAICLGLAGAGRPEDRTLFANWAATVWPGACVSIVSDAELALAAGTLAGWGLALICGTGSLAIGRDQAGRFARAGGWGYILGDEGSGYALGIGALQAVARAADRRGPPTALSAAVLDAWALATPAQLVGQVYQRRPANHEIAALAPLVHQAALAGDPVACQLLDAACGELALALVAVAQQLDFSDAVPCAFAGGLLVHAPLLADGVARSAAQHGLVLVPCVTVHEPAEGAIRLAARFQQ